MLFREFRKTATNFPIFRLNDIRKIDSGFHQPQLADWVNRGYVKWLAGEYYTLTEQSIDEQFLFQLANKLYEPSYISLESALAYYQIIPETVLGVTSVSSRKTKTFRSRWGMFRYRSMKPVYMFGYKVIETMGSGKIYFAKIEKAVLDYLYLNPYIQSLGGFDGLRWNKSMLTDLLRYDLFEEYLEIFNKQSLNKRVNELREYLYA